MSAASDPNRTATMADLAKQALKLPRPWIDGGVTAQEWCDAVDAIKAAAKP